MTMQDAFILALHIETNVPGLRVLAIGRFVRATDVHDELPWKVSVVCEHLEKPRVLSCDDDLQRAVVENHEAAPKQAELEGMLF